jgi:multiple sugar transport system permease protein
MANISNTRSISSGRSTAQHAARSKLIRMISAHAALIALSLVFLVPFLWLLSTSLKIDSQILVFPPVWFPQPITFQQYVTGLNYIPFLTYLKNTAIYCGVSVVGCIISSSLVAYSLARIRWPGRELLFAVIIATLMVPTQVTLIPLFLVFKQLGWIGSLKPLIVPYFFLQPFSIFLLRQFFLTIPHELSEAARVDGANEFRIYWSIIMPLATPVLATVGLFTFLGTWNDYLGPLIYLNDPVQYTLSLGLAQFQGEHNVLWGPLMAVSVVMIVPVLIAFFFTQRTFIQGITMTGIKG